MIHDKLVRAAKRAMQEIEATSEADSGHPLSNPENPWYADYNALAAAVDEIDDLAGQYKTMVANEADALLSNLDNSRDAEYDLETQFMHHIHEKLENHHPWVMDSDLAIVILQVSNHPCAEFAIHGGSVADDVNANDEFPFTAFAAEALVEDVKRYLYDNYELEVINNKTLRKAMKGV